MHFAGVALATAALASGALASMAPIVSNLTARAVTPHGEKMRCFTFPAGFNKGPVDTIHVWERIDREKSAKLRNPDPNKPELLDHSEYAANEDFIDGSHVDVITARVIQTKAIRWYETGLETRGQWVKTHPNAEKFPIRGYINEMSEKEQKQIASEANQECYYQGALQKGGAITSITTLRKQVKAYVKKKTYKVGVTDCLTTTNYLLSKMKIGKAPSDTSTPKDKTGGPKGKGRNKGKGKATGQSKPKKNKGKSKGKGKGKNKSDERTKAVSPKATKGKTKTKTRGRKSH